MWRSAETFAIELRRGVVMEAMCDFRCHHSTGGKGSEYLHAKPLVRFRTCLHIHLVENLRKKFHPVVIIHSKKLVVVFLADFVADDLSVNNSGHLVFTLRLCRLHGNVTDLYFPAMFLLTIPAFAFVE